MKIGIPLLVLGVLLLVFCIPYSVILIVAGFQSTGAVQSGFLSKILPYSPIVGVIVAFIMITIGASRTFKN